MYCNPWKVYCGGRKAFASSGLSYMTIRPTFAAAR
jgi:hypothetical protein